MSRATICLPESSSLTFIFRANTVIRNAAKWNDAGRPAKPNCGNCSEKERLQELWHKRDVKAESLWQYLVVIIGGGYWFKTTANMRWTCSYWCQGRPEMRVIFVICHMNYYTIPRPFVTQNDGIVWIKMHWEEETIKTSDFTLACLHKRLLFLNGYTFDCLHKQIHFY